MKAKKPEALGQFFFCGELGGAKKAEGYDPRPQVKVKLPSLEQLQQQLKKELEEKQRRQGGYQEPLKLPSLAPKDPTLIPKRQLLTQSPSLPALPQKSTELPALSPPKRTKLNRARLEELSKPFKNRSLPTKLQEEEEQIPAAKRKGRERSQEQDGKRNEKELPRKEERSKAEKAKNTSHELKKQLPGDLSIPAKPKRPPPLGGRAPEADVGADSGPRSAGYPQKREPPQRGAEETSEAVKETVPGPRDMLGDAGQVLVESKEAPAMLAKAPAEEATAPTEEATAPTEEAEAPAEEAEATPEEDSAPAEALTDVVAAPVGPDLHAVVQPSEAAAHGAAVQDGQAEEDLTTRESPPSRRESSGSKRESPRSRRESPRSRRESPRSRESARSRQQSSRSRSKSSRSRSKSSRSRSRSSASSSSSRSRSRSRSRSSSSRYSATPADQEDVPEMKETVQSAPSQHEEVAEMNETVRSCPSSSRSSKTPKHTAEEIVNDMLEETVRSHASGKVVPPLDLSSHDLAEKAEQEECSTVEGVPGPDAAHSDGEDDYDDATYDSDSFEEGSLTASAASGFATPSQVDSSVPPSLPVSARDVPSMPQSAR